MNLTFCSSTEIFFGTSEKPESQKDDLTMSFIKQIKKYKTVIIHFCIHRLLFLQIHVYSIVSQPGPHPRQVLP